MEEVEGVKMREVRAEQMKNKGPAESKKMS